MFSTIQSLNHYIRTIYGDSDLSFTGALWTVPIQGVGQGNGAGPQIWALVSTPILNLLRAEGYGAFFKAALSGTEIHFVGYGFVDNVDLIVTAKDPTDDFQTVLRMPAYNEASAEGWPLSYRSDVYHSTSNHIRPSQVSRIGLSRPICTSRSAAH